MAGNFPYVLMLALSSFILLGLTIWVFATFKQMMNCKNDPMIRCAIYECTGQGINSVDKFGPNSQLANNCKDGNCDNCVWGDGINTNECMSKWCDSNNQTGDLWTPNSSCYGKARQ